jgi:FixJ family two-component response regulator
LGISRASGVGYYHALSAGRGGPRSGPAQLLRLDPLLPVIIVTGNRDLEVARSTLKKGAFDYLPEPFDLHVLERIVAAAITRRDRARPESA